MCHCDKKIASTSVLVFGDYVRITVPEITLKAETRYCLILAQPCPVAGYNLPVQIVVGENEPYAMQKYGFGNIEFGQDLPACRNRIPTYFNNANQFIDLRDCERRCRCK